MERGSKDSDWQPAKDAARKLAFAEDRAIFNGHAASGIQGIAEGSSNQKIKLPAAAKDYSGAVAQAVSQLRLAGVDGPYALVLGAKAYTAASGGSDGGYPVLHHIERVVDGGVVWAPAIEGGFVLTRRGGDFVLDIGQDISIGYVSHDASSVTLELQESIAFVASSAEAGIALRYPPGS